MIKKSSKFTYVKEVDEETFIKGSIQITWWNDVFKFLKKKRFKDEIKIAKYLGAKNLSYLKVPFVFKTDDKSFFVMKKN